ncbi:hypothetical protein E2C01_017317 [Portunus trituberculatus]|uniref:Uncharacterized protein n=1 Tax=Portunus trituberculatus TaxID=210409 RepID=A0A5B7DS62_PORTR|nr:hypothetical protein [Portunus trituberculatus]
MTYILSRWTAAQGGALRLPMPPDRLTCPYPPLTPWKGAKRRRPFLADTRTETSRLLPRHRRHHHHHHHHYRRLLLVLRLSPSAALTFLNTHLHKYTTCPCFV